MIQNIKPEFKQWITKQLGTEEYELNPLPGDASFRSYYRAARGEHRYIVMLAPPEKEGTEAFVRIAKMWHQQGIAVPHILGWDQQQGFVLLSDFGDTLLLDCLAPENVSRFYPQAMQALLAIQKSTNSDYVLPLFDKTHTELELSYFPEWFLGKLLKISFDPTVDHLLEQVFNHLVKNMLMQPQVPVHRDFHSRNLMLLPENKLGIIDFQDAMIGPVTYDLVSLLKDCYITWPEEMVTHWVREYFEQLKETKQLMTTDFATFLRWFEWTGLQRHLKVLGIFARLKIRDQKSRYLGDMPRIMNYVLQITAKYDEFYEFNCLLQDKVVGILQQTLSQHIESLDTKVA